MAVVPFFCTLFLTGFGSAWYHLDPGNASLVWDRLPMTLAFMAFFAMVLGEYLSTGLAHGLLLPLLAVGLLSIAWWHITETQGRGDLRLYGLVQFLPMLLSPMILLMFHPRLNGSGYLWAMIAFYALSKAAEHFDAEIFRATGVISGHSVKHVAAAVGTLFFWLALIRRRAIGPARS